MKRRAEGVPYLSWGMIVRNASSTLEAALRSIRQRTADAEIVIVDTMSNDFPTEEEVAASVVRAEQFKPHEDGEGLCAECVPPIVYALGEPKTISIAKAYADVFVEYAGPNGTWNREMEAFDDAAAARNYAFAMCAGTWVGWIDADDLLPEPGVGYALLRANGAAPAKLRATHEPASGFSITYTLEQQLKMAEDKGIECLWAPYLYRFKKVQDVQQLLLQDELPEGFDPEAETWQVRERFVLRSKPWTWRGAAHEVLVPVSPDHPYQKDMLYGLLFVHMKLWTDEDAFFSMRRHGKILRDKRASGAELSTDELLYLENYSRFAEPLMRPEYVDEALNAAVTGYERMRARIAEGNFYAEQGFIHDACEAYAAAIESLPSAPEPYLAKARALQGAELWYAAAEAYEAAMKRPPNAQTTIVPRALEIDARLEAADCLWKSAQQLRAAGRWSDAAVLLGSARDHADAAFRSPAMISSVTKQAAASIANLCENEARLEHVLHSAAVVFDYLVANDETERAAAIARALPHNAPDRHPTVNRMHALAVKVGRHLSDPAAYQAFYEDQEAVGAVQSNEELLLEGVYEPRVHFLIDQLKAWRPNAVVAEFGCFDGNIGLPVLKALPEARYIGVEAQESAIARFRERAERWGVADRVSIHHSLEGAARGHDYLDAVVFYEVIEHVADPVGTIRRLLERLKPDGRLFLSTPWGSFDRGHPYNLPTRDPRGHVRALTPLDMHRMVRAAGGRIVEQGGTPGVAGFGATMHMAIERVDAHRAFTRRPTLVFAVSGALEDWNASKVEREGIGASEETIVYLAPKFAGARRVEVYGPLPEDGGVVQEETRAGVAYWPRDKVHNIDPRATVIVSRAPSYGALLGREAGTKLDKILWLQDTTYPDLNAETAKLYRKVVVLTPWHAELTAEQGVPEEKIEIINNFLIPEHFGRDVHGWPAMTADADQPAYDFPVRRPHHFIYASSPDRGLIPLLRMWPKILERYPDATLDVFYGWAGAKKLATASPAWVRKFKQVKLEHAALIHQPGVTERGRVNHVTLARELLSAAAYLYPGDPREGRAFAETGCLSAIKARAAGCVFVGTPYAGLVTSGADPLTKWVEVEGVSEEEYEEMFLDAVCYAVMEPAQERAEMARRAVAAHSLTLAHDAWRQVIDG